MTVEVWTRAFMGPTETDDDVLVARHENIRLVGAGDGVTSLYKLNDSGTPVIEAQYTTSIHSFIIED